MPVNTNAADIINALKDSANDTLKALLGSTPLQAYAIGQEGNFPCNWQSTLNVTLFNKPTYDWITMNLKAGASPLQKDQSFTNLYTQALSQISYSLSSADQSQLNQDAAKATVQQAALQNAWIAAYGSLPTPTAGQAVTDAISAIIQTTWSSKPDTTLMDIKNSINLSQLLSKAPASAQPILPVFVNWLNAMSRSLSLVNSVSLNNAYLGRALTAAQTPTKDNGGLLLSDNSYQPAYRVNTQVSDIQNSLQSGVPPVNLSMTVMRSTEKEFKVTVKGKVGFSIPILDFITIGFGGSASYFSDNIATTSNTTTVDMTFPGVNLVSFGPVDFTMAGATSSWFWMDPIRQAIANGDKDVSGYKFAPKSPVDFSRKGPFAYLTGVAISSYPTMKITVKSSEYQKIQKTFEQETKTSVSFLGIQLASLTESTYSNDVKVDAANQTVTITLSPPPSLVAGTVNEFRAWILGAQAAYPAA